jgi:hypothetical protein
MRPIIDEAIALTRAEVSALIRNPAPLVTAPEDRPSFVGAADGDGLFSLPSLAAGPELMELVARRQAPPTAARKTPAADDTVADTRRALLALPFHALYDPGKIATPGQSHLLPCPVSDKCLNVPTELMRFWAATVQYAAPLPAPVALNNATTPGRRRAREMDAAAASVTADGLSDAGEPIANRRRLNFDGVPAGPLDYAMQSQQSSSTHPSIGRLVPEGGGGGAFDGTGHTPAISLHHDARMLSF